MPVIDRFFPGISSLVASEHILADGTVNALIGVDDLGHAGKRQWLFAFGGGVIFNLGNLILLSAVEVAGMATAVPICFGLSMTLGIGIIAAFVLGDVAASDTPSTPKTWVAIVDVVAATFLLVWVVRLLRRPIDQQMIEGMVDKMSGVASSPAIAVVGAGAVLANPGGFIPLALKTISAYRTGLEQDPS